MGQQEPKRQASEFTKGASPVISELVHDRACPLPLDVKEAYIVQALMPEVALCESASFKWSASRVLAHKINLTGRMIS